jgi:hypothetical protein
MTRSPDSLIPFDAGQPAPEKRHDKAFNSRQEGEANLRAATEAYVRFSIVNPTSDRADSAGFIPGASLSRRKAKPATGSECSERPSRGTA